MERELYQLIALDKDGNEYVVELKNDNPNDRGRLEYIDSGTARFLNDEHLAEYLFNKGKIPTKEVSFFIKYNYKGEKFLPLIYNDAKIYNASKNINDKEIYYDILFFFLKDIEIALWNSDFYYYIVNSNNESAKQQKNGNQINQKLYLAIKDYFDSYVRIGDIDSNKAEIQYEILKELYSYKQFRTLYYLYKNYMNSKIKEVDTQNQRKDVKSSVEKKYENMPDIPDYIADAYEKGGMDEVYGVADLDDLVSKGIKFK